MTIRIGQVVSVDYEPMWHVYQSSIGYGIVTDHATIVINVLVVIRLQIIERDDIQSGGSYPCLGNADGRNILRSKMVNGGHQDQYRQ